MKKTFSFVVSIVFVGTSLSMPAFGAVKAGASCTKAGAISTAAGKKFTCVKSGKKLVWNNGITVMKSTTGTSSPKFVPPTLPTSFQDLEQHLSGIIYGSWLKSSEQLKSGTSNLGEIKVLKGPNSLPGNIDPSIPFALTSQLFSHFPQPKNVYAIVISYGDNEWAQSTFSQYQDLVYGNVKTAVSEICPVQACGRSIAFRNSKWDGVLLLQNGSRGSNPESDNRINSGMEYAHEYFHTIQFFTGRDRYYEAPSWFLEGSANWTGNIVAYHLDYSAYTLWRAKDLREQYGKSTVFTAAWVQEFLNSYASKKPPGQFTKFDYYDGPYPRYYQYCIGAMFTEIITSLKGPDSILAIYKSMANGNTFEQAFEFEFGKSWEEALPYISKAIAAELSQQVKS